MRERVEQGLFLEGGEAGAEEGSFRLLAEKGHSGAGYGKDFLFGHDDCGGGGVSGAVAQTTGSWLFGLQSPINAQLSRSVGVLEGSFLSFLGGTLVLGIAMLFFGKGHVGGVFGVPAWQLVGGLLGATVVFNTILCVPHIGVLPTLMAMILGNLIMGCIIDHFGWFGIPVTLFTWRRFLGVLLVLLGLLIAFRR